MCLGTVLSTSVHGQSSGGKRLSPDALVADLYRAHRQKRSPFFQTRSRALLYKYFGKNLADMIWKDAVRSKGEVGALDGDPLYNAQDMKIEKFVIGKPAIEGEMAQVGVSFENFGKPVQMGFLLVNGDAGWRITDIRWNDGSTLRSILTANASNAGATRDQNFQGTYGVGADRCNVTPIKMAFQVFCMGARTRTTYFYDSAASEESHKPTFTTESKSAKFVFDDEQFRTGKFVTTAGRELSLRKIKSQKTEKGKRAPRRRYSPGSTNPLNAPLSQLCTKRLCVSPRRWTNDSCYRNLNEESFPVRAGVARRLPLWLRQQMRGKAPPCRTVLPNIEAV